MINIERIAQHTGLTVEKVREVLRTANSVAYAGESYLDELFEYRLYWEDPGNVEHSLWEEED